MILDKEDNLERRKQLEQSDIDQRNPTFNKDIGILNVYYLPAILP